MPRKTSRPTHVKSQPQTGIRPVTTGSFLVTRGAQMAMKPYGAPACWGQQYTDGDRECVQCDARETCRAACMQRALQAPVPPRPSGPTLVPLPSRPFLPTMPQAPAIYRPQAPPSLPAPPVPQVAQPQIVQYQQMPPASLPDPANPHPLVPMMRPGAPTPAYYFCQYPSESTMTRLGKNVALRAAEATFGELMFFFRHWTWPPRS